MNTIRFRKTVLVAAIILCFGILTPCFGGGSSAAPAGPGAPQTLEIIFGMVEKPNQLDVVLREFYNRTRDTLNVNLNMTFYPNGNDFKEAINLKLSANEVIDSVFDAQWHTMNDMIAKGAYIPLDEYFNNPAYPGLQKCFSGDMYLNNRFRGPDNQMHLYGIPFTQTFADLGNFLIIRQDWREAAGLPPLRDMDDFEKYCDWILANKPGVYPIGRNGDVPNWLWEQPGISGSNVTKGGSIGYTEVVDAPFSAISIGQGIQARVIYTPDFSRAIAVGWPGMLAADYIAKGVPANLASMMESKYVPALSDIYKTRGYVEPDVAQQNQTRPLFHAGMFGAVFGGWGNLETDRAQMAQISPEARLEVFMFSADRRDMKPRTFSTDYMAFNFQCVPVTSKNPARVMELYSWIFENEDNNGLFQWGIKGVHWEPVGADRWRVPAGVNRAGNYTPVGGGYQFTWNPQYIRYSAEQDETIMAYNMYMTRPDTYVGRPTAGGFTFNSEPVRSQFAAAGQIYVDNFANKAVPGTTPEQKRAMDLEALARMKAVGLDAIDAEILRQVNSFLASKK